MSKIGDALNSVCRYQTAHVISAPAVSRCTLHGITGGTKEPTQRCSRITECTAHVHKRYQGACYCSAAAVTQEPI